MIMIPCRYCENVLTVDHIHPEFEVLEMLCKAHVFYTELNKDKTEINFIEDCDNHFELSLNKKQMIKLIEELKLLENKMTEENTIK
jgi:hypothetical protein